MSEGKRRWPLWVAAVLVAVLVLVNLVLFVPWFFQYALRAANAFLPVRVEVGAYRHAPGALTLGEVRVSSDRGVICTVRAVEADYGFLSLFLGRPRVRALEVEGVRMHVERYPDGSFNLSGLGQGRRGPGAAEPFRPEVLVSWASLPVSVKKLGVADIHVEYADAVAGVHVDVRGLRVSGEVDTRPLRARLDWESPHVRVLKGGTERSLALEGRGSVRLADHTVEFAGVQLRPVEGLLEVQGSWDLKTNRLAATADLRDVPLGRILADWGIHDVPVTDLNGQIEVGAESFRDAGVVAALRAVACGRDVRVDLNGTVGSGVVRLDSIFAREAEMSLTGEGTLEIATARLEARARLEAPVLEETLRAYGLAGNRLDGLRLDAEIGGTIETPEFRGSVFAEKWSFGEETFLAGIDAEGTYDRRTGGRLTGTARGGVLVPEGTPGELRFSGRYEDGLIQGAADSGPAMQLKGRFQTDTQHAEVSFNARRLCLTRQARLWVPDLSRVTLTGAGRFQGDVRDRTSWKGEAKIDDFSASAPEVHLVASRAAAIRLRDGGVYVELAARLNGEPLELEGTLPIVPGGQVRVRGQASLSLTPFQGILISRVPFLQRLEGELEVSGRVDGTMGAPVLRAAARFRDGWVTVAPGGEAGDGDGPGQPVPIFQGRLEGSADLHGPLRTPAGSLKVQATHVSLYGFPVQEVWLALAGDTARWSTDRFQVKTEHGSVSLDGSWDPQTQRISGRVQSTDWGLGGMLVPRGIPVDGQARVEGSVRGTLGAPRVSLQVPVTALTVEGQPYGDLQGTVDLEPGRLSTRWRLAFGEIGGSLLLDGTRRAEVYTSLKEFPLGPLLDTWQDRGWNARASLDGNLEGPLSDLSLWRGEVTLSRFESNMTDVPVRLAEPVRVSFSPGEISVPGAELLFGDSSLVLEGTLGRENRFSAKGTADLALFGDLLPWVRIEHGTTQVDVRIGGTILDPSVEGEVRLDARDLWFPGLPFPFPVQRLTAELAGSAGTLDVKFLRAQVQDGSLSARGRITLQPLAVEGLDLVLASVPVSLSDHLTGVLQGTLHFEGSEASSLLKGAVRVEHARYDQDFDLLGTVLSPRRPRPPVGREPHAFLRNMQLDIRVHSGPDIVVRNNIARMILSMDVHAGGTAAAVAPGGRVRVQQGNVYFANRDFDVTQGSLLFLGAPDTYPTLQLDSRTHVEGRYRHYRVLLSMDGPLDRIHLTLGSSPVVSQDDLLFVLFTGMTQEEYFATPTDLRGGGAALVASGFSALLEKDVKAWTGLDTFELGGYEREGLGVQATVGKRIGERVRVRGTVAVGEQFRRGEAQVEYELADGFFLVGTHRTDGSFGLDLRFRFVGR